VEFVAKIGVVVEEVDEAVLWLELMTESGIVETDKIHASLKEANELTAIFAASQRTARQAV
jgi:four helix bundle protein